MARPAGRHFIDEVVKSKSRDGEEKDERKRERRRDEQVPWDWPAGQGFDSAS
jgi:hypothetical protein